MVSVDSTKKGPTQRCRHISNDSHTSCEANSTHPRDSSESGKRTSPLSQHPTSGYCDAPASNIIFGGTRQSLAGSVVDSSSRRSDSSPPSRGYEIRAGLDELLSLGSDSISSISSTSLHDATQQRLGIRHKEKQNGEKGVEESSLVGCHVAPKENNVDVAAENRRCNGPNANLTGMVEVALSNTLGGENALLPSVVGRPAREDMADNVQKLSIGEAIRGEMNEHLPTTQREGILLGNQVGAITTPAVAEYGPVSADKAMPVALFELHPGTGTAVPTLSMEVGDDVQKDAVDESLVLMSSVETRRRVRTLTEELHRLSTQNRELREQCQHDMSQTEQFHLAKIEAEEHSLFLQTQLRSLQERQSRSVTNDEALSLVGDGVALENLRGAILHKTKMDLREAYEHISELQTALEKTRFQLDEDAKRHGSEIRSIKRETQHLVTELATRSVLNNHAERKLQQLTEKSTKTEENLAVNVASAAAQSKTLQAQLREVEGKWRSEVERVASMQVENEKVHNDLENSQALGERLTKEMTDLRREADTFRTQLEHALAHRTSSDVEKDFESELCRLQGELSAAEQDARRRVTIAERQSNRRGEALDKSKRNEAVAVENRKRMHLVSTKLICDLEQFLGGNMLLQNGANETLKELVLKAKRNLSLAAKGSDDGEASDNSTLSVDPKKSDLISSERVEHCASKVTYATTATQTEGITGFATCERVASMTDSGTSPVSNVAKHLSVGSGQQSQRRDQSPSSAESNSQLRLSLQNREQQISKLQADYTALQSNVEERLGHTQSHACARDIENMRLSNARLSRELSTLMEQNRCLENENLKVLGKAIASEKACVDAKGEAARLKEQLGHVRSQLSSTIDEKKSSQAHAEEVTQKLNGMSDKVRKLEENFQSTKQMVEVVQSEKRELVKTKHLTALELQGLKKNLSLLELEAERRHTEMSKIKDELSRAMGERAALELRPKPTLNKQVQATALTTDIFVQTENVRCSDCKEDKAFQLDADASTDVLMQADHRPFSCTDAKGNTVRKHVERSEICASGSAERFADSETHLSIEDANNEQAPSGTSDVTEKATSGSILDASERDSVKQALTEKELHNCHICSSPCFDGFGKEWASEEFIDPSSRQVVETPRSQVAPLRTEVTEKVPGNSHPLGSVTVQVRDAIDVDLAPRRKAYSTLSEADEARGGKESLDSEFNNDHSAAVEHKTTATPVTETIMSDVGTQTDDRSNEARSNSDLQPRCTTCSRPANHDLTAEKVGATNAREVSICTSTSSEVHSPERSRASAMEPTHSANSSSRARRDWISRDRGSSRCEFNTAVKTLEQATKYNNPRSKSAQIRIQREYEKKLKTLRQSYKRDLDLLRSDRVKNSFEASTVLRDDDLDLSNAIHISKMKYQSERQKLKSVHQTEGELRTAGNRIISLPEDFVRNVGFNMEVHLSPLNKEQRPDAQYEYKQFNIHRGHDPYKASEAHEPKKLDSSVLPVCHESENSESMNLPGCHTLLGPPNSNLMESSFEETEAFVLGVLSNCGKKK